MAVLIETKTLTKRYGSVTALDAVDIRVEEGITGLLGPNGAGKSTAIKLFLGLLKPSNGTIDVMGSGPSERVTTRARLGYMPEHDCLPSMVNATEFLTHMAQVSGLPPTEAKVRAADVLRHVSLDEERYRAIGGYSTGMKQRVKLAQALVHDPVLVLLDEPTSGLDPAGREEMLDLVKRTGREFGISILLSSHLMGEVEETCGRIIVLEDGRVTHADAVSEFTRETDEVVIDVTSHQGAIVAAMRARDLEASIDATSIVVKLKNEDEYDIIRDVVAEAGAGLRRITARRTELTDIFQGLQG